MAGRIRGMILGAILVLGLSVAPGSAGAQAEGQGGMNSGEVSLIRVAARKAGLRDFQMFSKTGPSGRLILEGFSASLGGGQIRGTGLVDFANPAGPHRMRVELSKVDGMSFLHLLEVKLNGTVQARVDGVFDLQWRGTTAAQARRSLSGTAQWKSGPGFVADVDVMLKAADLTGIAALRRFDVRTAGASGTFRDGILDVKKLLVSGAGQEVTGAGQLDVSSREIRMALRMRVAPELIESSARPEVRALGMLARGMRDSAGEAKEKLVPLPMPLSMTGKVQDPEFQFGPLGTLDTGLNRSSAVSSPSRKRK